jgi:hypothetical protein
MKLTSEWRKSSKSGPYSDNCVECRLDAEGNVKVRNSKRPDAGIVVFTSDEWTAFTAGVRNDEFEV